ncbi:MAG: hypothetical protein CBC48_14025 [bacterium TMED88]|nr:MAG: hypothetical protein CBC48_14025 [bacterium TMED88]
MFHRCLSHLFLCPMPPGSRACDGLWGFGVRGPFNRRRASERALREIRARIRAGRMTASVVPAGQRIGGPGPIFDGGSPSPDGAGVGNFSGVTGFSGPSACGRGQRIE